MLLPTTVANGSQLISSDEAKKGHAQALSGAGAGVVLIVAGETSGQRLAEPNTGDLGMKKLFLATTALVVLAATSAGAADMYARASSTAL